MPSHKKTCRRKRPIIKRLLDDVLPKRSLQLITTPVMNLVTDISYSQSSTEVVTSSSSSPKRFEEVVTNDQGTSPEPTLLIGQTSSSQRQDGEQLREARAPISANNELFYTSIYRQYSGITPPNPRLYNPRLLEDYIDWYMNVYIEEEAPWQYLNTGNPADRSRRDEQEAIEQAEKFASASSEFKNN